MCCLVAFFFQPAKIVQASTENEGQDFIFVVDGSYSMNTNDPQKHIFELMRYMTSLSEGTSNRIGYVIYNDSIIKDQELKQIANTKEKEQMMTELTRLTRIKGTDIGIGLKTANRILKEGHYNPNRTALIVLSDGDVDVSANNPNRTQADANRDVQAVVEKADYPIYTVQYSEIETRNKAPMNTWGVETGGKSYSATTVQQLIHDATDIYSRQTKMALEKTSIAAKKTANDTFELEIPVRAPKNEKITEIIVTLQDSARITNITLPDDGKNISLRRSNATSIITIDNPKTSGYKITYKTKDNKPVEYQTIRKVTPQKALKFPIWPIIIAISLLLAVVLYYVWRLIQRVQIKKRNTYFHDALEGYFMKTPSDEDIPIQNWNATMFIGQGKVTLFDLLKGNPMQTQMQTSKHIYVAIGMHNQLEITTKSTRIEVIQNRQTIPNKKTCQLKAGESLYLIFHESGIELELRVRKVSYKG